MIDQDGINVFMERPFMVVVQAKRTEVPEKANSKAQLLAQIRHLQLQQ
jgi:hypothetical protein